MADFSRDSIIQMLSDKTISNCLKQRDLTFLDLSSLDLSNIDMEGSNLLGTNFQYSNLSNSNLSNCYLANVNFADTDLTGTNLENSILTGANFKDSIFRSVNLTDTKIEYDNLIDTIFCNISNVRKNLTFESEPHIELKRRVQKKFGELKFVKGSAIYQDDSDDLIALDGQNYFLIWLRTLLKRYNHDLSDFDTKAGVDYYLKPLINLIEKIIIQKIGGLKSGDDEILIPAKHLVDKLAVQLVRAFKIHEYRSLSHRCLLTISKYLNISVQDAVSFLKKREIHIDPNPLAEIDFKIVVLLKWKFFENASLSDVLKMVNNKLPDGIDLRVISNEIITEIIRKLNTKQRYTIIKSDGNFLGVGFFSKISLEKNGLYNLESLSLSFNKTEDISISKKTSFADWSGNVLTARELEAAQSVLSNSTLDHKSLLLEKELINFNFYTPDQCEYNDSFEGKYAPSRGQSNKKPFTNFEFDIFLTNGLKFSCRVGVTRGSDYWYRARIQINDRKENKVDFHVFYKYLKMLTNGEELIHDFYR